jgi:geranylgeranyl diphosphate synthase type I
MTAIESRTATEILAWGRAMLDPALRLAVDTLPDMTRRAAGYHLGWWEADGTRADGDAGKAIRPTLALLAAEAAGGDAAMAVPAAVAVELVHNFSLLQDDVMDRDVARRHRPTVWSVFGISTAILSGDGLLSRAFDVLVRTGEFGVAATRMLDDAVQQLLQGQADDVSFEERSDVDIAECVRMAERKTGALIAASCGLGALLGGGSGRQVERLTRFGAHLGLAFQVTDDLLGIWGDPRDTGKSAHSDLACRKKSMPVVAALNDGGPAARELAELYQRDGDLTEPELVHAAELVEQAGGRAWCQRKADELLARAFQDLFTTGPDARCTAELSEVARLATRRER